METHVEKKSDHEMDFGCNHCISGCLGSQVCPKGRTLTKKL